MPEDAGATIDMPGPPLDREERAALAAARQAWAGTPRVTGAGSRIDPDLHHVQRGQRAGQHYVRVLRPHKQGFQSVAPGQIQATVGVGAPTHAVGRVRHRVRRALLGQPLSTAQAVHERLTKVKALAVLSSDALSSVAYATEQILVYLVPTGAMGYRTMLPIAAAIGLLLVIVVLSYRQTIRAYPHGGGSYIVASDNLGHLAGLIAGCALMTSYTMTVAVSVASGADAIVSALPGADSYRWQLCLGFILLLTLGNLRGIRESGSIFAAPTYLFIVAVFLTVGSIAIKVLTGTMHPANTDQLSALPHGPGVQSLTIVIILRAFASGASALTGVEAISDGVPAFKAPEWVNARTTLTSLGVVLGAMFIGITICTYLAGVVSMDPHGKNYETVLSQLGHVAFGPGAFYIYLTVSTTAILVLAGNTAFSDFPRLLFFMSRDDYAPHQFKRLGDRLAFSNGILVLGVLSALVVLYFNESVEKMIPLYAIGVFTAFTMSQAGMCVRWVRLHERGWRKGLAMNIAGVIITFTVFLINAVFKFTEGAWVIIALVPVLVLTTLAIHRHYHETTAHVSTDTPTSPAALNPVCIVPIVDLNGPALQSLALARKLSETVIAVHISDDETENARLQAKWEQWGNHVPLEIIVSPYRSLIRPLLGYIEAIDRQQVNDTIVVVLPEMVSTRWWHQVLHNQSALRIKAALLFRPGTVVINVPYHLSRTRRVGRRGRARVDGDDDSEML